MLFNSYPFLFAFLPAALVGYQIAGHFHRRAVVAWLGFVSLVFYAYWRPPLVVLLLCSIGINYLAAELISRHIRNTVGVRAWLWLAIAIDLGPLSRRPDVHPPRSQGGTRRDRFPHRRRSQDSCLAAGAPGSEISAPVLSCEAAGVARNQNRK